jgi:hypothetical protein
MKVLIIFTGFICNLISTLIYAIPVSVNITITNLKSEISVGSFPQIDPLINGSILSGTSLASMTCTAYGGSNIAVTIAASPGINSGNLISSDTIKILVAGGSEKTLTSGGNYLGTQNLITFSGTNPGPRNVTITYNGEINRPAATIVTALSFITTAN